MSRLPRLHRRILGVLPLALSAACLGSTEPQFEYDPEVIEETDFDASLEIDLSQMTQTAIGVYIQDLVVGEGLELESGKIFTVIYTGWLSNGYEFDSGTIESTELGGDLRFVPGFEYGLLGMKPGGTRRIIIPPEWAYGAAGTPGGVIPPGAILIFLLELTSVVEG